MAEIEQLTYSPPTAAVGAVEVISFERLRTINDGGTQRADFHVLAIVEGGHGTVLVDFDAWPLARHSMTLLPPGTVHRWEDIASLMGRLVLFTPTAPVTEGARRRASTIRPTTVVATDAEARLVAAALDHLELELGEQLAGPTTAIPAILLSALLTRLPERAASPAGNRLHERFQREVEAGFRRHHDVGYYARRLGYSPRTLSRAVAAATGATAKAYLLARLTLEAKRMLAHDRLTAAGCAAALGFADVSNFSKFFLRETGSTPGRWQRDFLA